MEVKNGEESPGKKDHQLLAGSPGRLEALSLTALQGLAKCLNTALIPESTSSPLTLQGKAHNSGCF